MAITVDRLRIVEVIQKIESGMTEPVLCKLEDDFTYCVKGKGAMPRGLISEVIAGAVGKAMGLPIPDFAIAQLSTGLAAAAADANEIKLIGPNPGFASLWQEPAETFLPSMQGQFPSDLMAKIYLFDHWIKNGDRSLTEFGGNVNLLVRFGTRHLVVIDHNLAFSPSYKAEELRVHVGYPAWQRMKSNEHFVAALRLEMGEALRSVDEIANCLPDEWLDAEPSLVGEALTTLERFEQPEFWDEIG